MGVFSDVLASVVDFGLGQIGSQQDWSKQKRLAQEGIQWRVADAKKAGIHPLYALGAPTMSWGGSFGGGSPSSIGQDLSRAITAGQTAMERRREAAAAIMRADAAEQREAEAHDSRMATADVERQLLLNQIARMNSQVGPGAVEPQASQPIVSALGEPSRQAGVITDFQYSRTRDGGLALVPSEDIANRFDEIPGAGIGWSLRNNLLPTITGQIPPYPDVPTAPGFRWEWNRIMQAWYERPVER